MLLYEALYKEESEDYSKGGIYLYPLISDARMALKAISDCNIEELQDVLYIAENFHRDDKYDKDYEIMRDKLQRVLNFMKNFNKRFSEMVDKSVFEIPADTDSIIAGNVIQMISQDDQLDFEESLVILHSLRPIANRLPTGGYNLMADIYFTGLNICERHNTFGKQFVILISQNGNWFIDYFIRECSPRLDNILYRGISSILHSKAEIRNLDDDLKKDLKRAYKVLTEKEYKFNLVERYRSLLL